MSREDRVRRDASLTIPLTPELTDRLDRLAGDRQRSRSVLAAEATAAWLGRERAVADGIRRGLADVAAGRVTGHDEAMAQVEAAIVRARGRQG